MQETKDLFNKNSGNVGYHIIQSFDDNEGTNEQVFEIGCRLAEELFGDKFEVIVALHKNTDNLHCHVVVNSVSFVDGKKFNDNKAFLNKMRNVSDRLCREQGLSVIENPKPSKHQCYPQYIAERDGEYNKFTTLKKDIDECILRAGTERGFLYEMQKLGYLESRGFKHVGTWQFSDAKKLIDLIAANGWRTPSGINPATYMPE